MKNHPKADKSSENLIFIASLVTSTAVIITAVLQLFNIWDNTINVTVPLLGLSMVFQTVREWNKHRVSAIFSLCSAALIFICAVIILFLNFR